jgi:hypothetical protein
VRDTDPDVLYRIGDVNESIFCVISSLLAALGADGSRGRPFGHPLPVSLTLGRLRRAGGRVVGFGQSGLTCSACGPF